MVADSSSVQALSVHALSGGDSSSVQALSGGGVQDLSVQAFSVHAPSVANNIQKNITIIK